MPDTTKGGPRKGRPRVYPTPESSVAATLARLTARDRARILARLAELHQLDRLIREPGTLAEVGM